MSSEKDVSPSHRLALAKAHTRIDGRHRTVSHTDRDAAPAAVALLYAAMRGRAWLYMVIRGCSRYTTNLWRGAGIQVTLEYILENGVQYVV